MNTYLIMQNQEYGIYQTEKNMSEVKDMFDYTILEKWDEIEQIQEYAKKLKWKYVGYDMFYK